MVGGLTAGVLSAFPGTGEHLGSALGHLPRALVGRGPWAGGAAFCTNASLHSLCGNSRTFLGRGECPLDRGTAWGLRGQAH